MILNKFIHYKNYSVYYIIKPIVNVKQTLFFEKEFDDFVIYKIKQVDIFIGYAIKLNKRDDFLLLNDSIIKSNASLTNDYYFESNNLFTIIKDVNNTLIIFEDKVTLKELRKC